MKSILLPNFANIQYDAVGNMLSVTSTIASQPSYGGYTSYTYDTKNELTKETATGAGGYTGSYGYDSAGNPTTFKGVAQSFNAANQNTANAYDKAGNPTTYKGVGLTFDAENRMTSYGGSTLTNGFRGDSLRAWKQNASGKTYFLYSGSLLVCELNSSGTVTSTITDGPAGLLSRHTSSGSVFYAFDTHSSVVQRLSSTGAVLSTQTFDAYGSRLSTDGNADPYAGYGGQNGYYTDWETGTASSALALLTFRYYDPSAGRFLTRDPAGYKGGANPYEYVGDGPTGKSDPLGTMPPSIGSVVGGCIAALAVLNDPGDTCNSAYNQCKQIYDCIAEALSAAIAWIVVATVDFFTDGLLAGCSEAIEGCLEGILSAGGHYAVEQHCDPLKKCPSTDSDDDKKCALLGAMTDVFLGCVDGLIGQLLEVFELKYLVNQAIESVIEGAIAAFGLNSEVQCESGTESTITG